MASVVSVGGAIEGLGYFVWQRLSSIFGSYTFTVARFSRSNVSYEEFEDIHRIRNYVMGISAQTEKMEVESALDS